MRTHLPEKVQGTDLRDIKSVGGARPPHDLHPWAIAFFIIINNNNNEPISICLK